MSAIFVERSRLLRVAANKVCVFNGFAVVPYGYCPDGSLLIRKVCATNPSVTLQNAEFKITYSDGTFIGDSNGIYRTDENGGATRS